MSCYNPWVKGQVALNMSTQNTGPSPYVAGILIVGSSLIKRLDYYLQRERRSWHVSLPVRLLGKSGLTMAQLRPLLDEWVAEANPAYLVIHCGANDIGKLQKLQWVQEMEIIILYIRARWPRIRLIWSDMLPRQHWRYSLSPQRGEHARRKCQQNARALVYAEGGSVIRYPLIKPTAAFLLEDGVHLTKLGQEVYFQSMEQGLQESIGI